MIKLIIELLKEVDTKDKEIQIAKGLFESPKNIREAVKKGTLL